MHFIALIALFIVATAWGATFTVTKDVVSRITTEEFLFWRFLLASMVLLGLAWRKRQLDRTVVRDGVLMGAVLFAGYWLQTRGLVYTTPSRSSFITALNVILVPLLEPLINRTPVPRTGMLAALLATLGTFLLVGGIELDVNRGDVMAFSCAFAFALFLILGARLSRPERPIGLTAIQILTVALIACPFGARRIDGTDHFVIGVIVATALITTAFAFLVLMWAQARISATEAAIVLAFEPVATAITDVVWYGVPPARGVVFGGALIVLGMVVSQWRRAGTKGEE